jgi:hypothetical protein
MKPRAVLCSDFTRQLAYFRTWPPAQTATQLRPLKIEKRPVSAVVPYDGNARLYSTEQVDESGLDFRKPVLVVPPTA